MPLPLALIRILRLLFARGFIPPNPYERNEVLDKIQESWKAVVALLIPIAFGAAIQMIDALNAWAAEAGGIWSGVLIGVFTGIGVWLKANKPPS